MEAMDFKLPRTLSLLDRRFRQHAVPGAGPWLVRFGDEIENVGMRIFCFPCAGGGVGDYREWAVECAPQAEVIAMQLPGRGARFGETPVQSIVALVEELVPAMAGLLDRPFVLFGHSMGGRIAYALANRLKRTGLPAPEVLVVSASRPPTMRGNGAASMPDLELRRYLENLGGVPRQALENAEIMEFMLPLLRAEFQLNDSLPLPVEPLLCAVVACGGKEDRVIQEKDLEGWGLVSRGDFRLEMFPGGHFYLREERTRLVQMLLNYVKL
jgi:medium-chain acyl-[acyl-carrier-protein] hydrolase